MSLFFSSLRYFNAAPPQLIHVLHDGITNPYIPYFRHAPNQLKSPIKRPKDLVLPTLAQFNNENEDANNNVHSNAQNNDDELLQRSQTPTWLDSTVSNLVEARERHNDLSSSQTSIASSTTQYSDYDYSASYIITSLSIRRYTTMGSKWNTLLGLFEAVSEAPQCTRPASFTSQIDRLMYEQYSERHLPLPKESDVGNMLRVASDDSISEAPTPPPLSSFDADPTLHKEMMEAEDGELAEVRC